MATQADDKMIMFQNRLTKQFRHLGRQAKRLGVTCYRLYDHDLPEFPFCIEIYEDRLYVAEYKRRHGLTDEEHDHWIETSLEVLTAVLNIPKEKIVLKLRQRKAGRLGQYQKQDKLKDEFTVGENGLKFIVNLSDYLDTGLFLDHRATRQLVKDQCHSKRLLNLFCYTGSFSVYGAAGGASEIVSVDLSNTYLNWAKRNMVLNGFIGGSYRFEQRDVKEYLKTVEADHFDIIVMDPPTFSNSKRMNDFLDIQRDHVELINDCLGALVQGGVLYFSTNYTKFKLESSRLSASTIKDITKATTSFDFEGRPNRVCFRIAK